MREHVYYTPWLSVGESLDGSFDDSLRAKLLIDLTELLTAFEVVPDGAMMTNSLTQWPKIPRNP